MSGKSYIIIRQIRISGHVQASEDPHFPYWMRRPWTKERCAQSAPGIARASAFQQYENVRVLRNVSVRAVTRFLPGLDVGKCRSLRRLYHVVYLHVYRVIFSSVEWLSENCVKQENWTVGPNLEFGRYSCKLVWLMSISGMFALSFCIKKLNACNLSASQHSYRSKVGPYAIHCYISAKIIPWDVFDVRVRFSASVNRHITSTVPQGELFGVYSLQLSASGLLLRLTVRSSRDPGFQHASDGRVDIRRCCSTGVRAAVSSALRLAVRPTKEPERLSDNDYFLRDARRHRLSDGQQVTRSLLYFLFRLIIIIKPNVCVNLWKMSDLLRVAYKRWPLE